MTKKLFKDIVERTVTTYAEALVGLLIASGIGTSQVTDLSVFSKAAIAAIPAGLAVVKGALAKLHGNSDSASLAGGV